MSRVTRILLVDCSRPLEPERREVYDTHHPPVGLLSLATHVKKSDMGPRTEIVIVDGTVDFASLDELQDIAQEFEPEILGLRCLHLYTELFHAATAMAKRLPSPPLTVGGGPYPSAAPIQTLEKDQCLDLVALGEGEATFLELVQALHYSRDMLAVPGLYYRDTSGIKASPARAPIQDLDSLPHPDWTLIDFDRYSQLMGQAPVLRKAAPIVTSRGCPYHCSYCHNLFQRRPHVRSPEHILEELLVLDGLGVRDISVIDDIFNLDAGRVIKLFDLCAKKNLRMRFYFPNGLRGDRMPRDLIDAMVDGGCVLFTYALESGSERIQELIKKRLKLDKLRTAIDYTIGRGVLVDMFLMLGFPTETREEAAATIEFVKQWDEISFPYLMAVRFFPGTELYNWAVREGYSVEEIGSVEAFDKIRGIDPEMILSTRVSFLRDYFLRRTRLEKVIPRQRKFLRDDEILCKYKSYFPMKLDHINDLRVLVDTIAVDPRPVSGPSGVS